MEYLKEVYKINLEDLKEDLYLRNIPSLKIFQGLKIEKPVTFFVGENGSGTVSYTHLTLPTTPYV